MYPSLSILPTVLIACLLCACGSTGSDNSTVAQATAQSFEDRIKGGYTVGEDAQGNPQMQSQRRSSFENAQFQGSLGEVEGSSYSKKAYRSERWLGRRSYQTSAYGGQREAQGYDAAPHYLRKNAHLAQNSQEQGRSFGTSRYQTRRTKENGRAFATRANAYAENRRDKRPQVPITSFKEEQELSIEDTRRMLGR